MKTCVHSWHVDVYKTNTINMAEPDRPQKLVTAFRLTVSMLCKNTEKHCVYCVKWEKADLYSNF